MPRPPAEHLIAALRTGALSAADLARTLQVSQATISRLTSALSRQNQVLRSGTTRGARYALRHSVANIGSSWPVYSISREGVPTEMGSLYALASDQFYFEARATALPLNGLSNGLPYFLQDQRPAGFLGRTLPQQYPELELPPRVQDWADDQYLVYLTQRGSDATGNLIVGTQSLDRFLANPPASAAIPALQRELRYPAMAGAAMAGGIPGSSAQGEHPKFTALLQADVNYTAVLVKFSPPRDTSIGQRWSDLLIAEHHAHVLLESAGIQSCVSQIMLSGNRTFLEVVRFDRSGAAGRIGVVSLYALDTSFYGQLDHWTAAAERLSADGRIDAADLERIRLLSAFGAMIANTDRHFGNLTFFDDYTGRFRLAPVYDMLPMLFAPEHAQIVQRTFVAPAATAQLLPVWSTALVLAQRYWAAVASDERIGTEFREIAAACDTALTRNGLKTITP